MAEAVNSCGLQSSLRLIGGKWKFLVLWHVGHGPIRFGDLRRAIGGISEKMLIQELKEMIADELIARKDFQEVPPRVEYSLTRFGVSLAAALRPLCEWGTAQRKRIDGITGEESIPYPPKKAASATRARRGSAVLSA